MRDKIASMIMSFLVQSETNDMGVLADKILALLPSLDGIVVEEECNHVTHVIQEGSRDHVMIYETNGMHCSTENCERNCACNGTGTITRQAEWGDIDVAGMIEARSIPDYRTKSGGKLKVKE